MGFKKYFRAAFSGWLPLPGLGLFPINWVLLTIVMLSTIIGFFAGGPLAGLGIFLVASSVDIGIVLALTFSGSFQRFIDNMEMISNEEEEVKYGKQRLDKMLSDLDEYSKAKFLALKNKVDEVVKLFNQLHPEAQDLELSKVRGLNTLLNTYYQLLISRQLINNNIKPKEEEDLNSEIEALERRNLKEKSERVKKSFQGRLEILRKRAEKISQLNEVARLVESELNRILDQIELIKADALTAKDPDAFSQRVDSVSAEFETNSEWAKQQYQILDDLSLLNLQSPDIIGIEKKQKE